MKTWTIYLLTNSINNKIYVGQTSLSLRKRMAKNGSNYRNSTYLFNAITKYGAENFVYTVLAEASSLEEANNLECLFIVELDSRNPEIGYNIKEGGSHGPHSEETKAKISATQKLKPISEERLAHIRALGLASKGQIRGPHTDEWKATNSERTKLWHAENDHPMLGKRHSDKTRLKQSIANKGKPNLHRSPKSGKPRLASQIEDAIIKAYQEGRTWKSIAAEFKTSVRKIGALLKERNIPKIGNYSKWTGQKHTEETKQKQSEAAVKGWEEKRQLKENGVQNV